MATRMPDASAPATDRQRVRRNVERQAMAAMPSGIATAADIAIGLGGRMEGAVWKRPGRRFLSLVAVPVAVARLLADAGFAWRGALPGSDDPPGGVWYWDETAPRSVETAP